MDGWEGGGVDVGEAVLAEKGFEVGDPTGWFLGMLVISISGTGYFI